MAAKGEKRIQPTWKPPVAEQQRLKLFNSLTRRKEDFIPQSGNKVLWYSCGPTVYDASHMGHARSYISFDILRRVLSNYFSYDVFYVMNITDIDDKIIKRARQNFLLEDYKNKNHAFATVLVDVETALAPLEKQLPTVTDPDKKNMRERLLVKTKDAISNAENTLLSEPIQSHEQGVQRLISDSRDVLAEWLDDKHGFEVVDNSIFQSLPAQWEQAFYEDMEALNILPADAVTRVSEYIPEIISYIEKIIGNEMAYESNGSVYFNTVKFDQAPGHFYGKLVPEAFGDLKSLHEGEGDLSVSEERLNEKLNASDFAVWKASKKGEPSWDSPWGKGRPGWHIECSVMASALLGSSLDIHTGGFDLKFPHHDNELAQAEAYYDNDNWVRYFLHSGHLTISGCKMSKSLKNFVTIKEALKEYSANHLRFAFLLHSWRDTLDYSSRTMEMAVQYEKMVMEFFLNVKNSIRAMPSSGRDAFVYWGSEDCTLNQKFQEKQAEVHAALCDNIDTRTTLDSIRDLISTCNVYMRNMKMKSPSCNRQLLQTIVSYISRILNVYGIDDKVFGFSQSGGSRGENLEEKVLPYLSAFADFRESVRCHAKSTKESHLLKLCDDLRDNILPNLGVRLEDHEGTAPVIKLVDREILLKERIMKLKMEEDKKIEKENKKRQQEEMQAAKDSQKKIPPSEMFQKDTDKYSKFDEKTTIETME